MHQYSPHVPHSHMNRCIGTGKTTSPMTQPTRLMYPSVSDGAYEPAPSPSPHFSLKHTHRYIGPHNTTRPVDYTSEIDGSTRLTYTGLCGELEHLKIKIETRFIGESFECVMGECEIYFLKGCCLFVSRILLFICIGRA